MTECSPSRPFRPAYPAACLPRPVLLRLQTFMVGKVDERGEELVETAYRCLAAAVDMVQPGAMYRDLGASIGKIARERGQREGGRGREGEMLFMCCFFPLFLFRGRRYSSK